MGLDMYLSARRYVRKYDYKAWDETLTEEFQSLAATAPDDFMKYGDFSGITITYPIAYWRKANAIHGWFVRNCGNNQDTCQEMYVSTDDLRNLRAACIQVQMRPELAEELLPPTHGFFFGGYEIDQHYMFDLRNTIDILTHVIDQRSKMTDDFNFEMFYQASW